VRLSRGGIKDNVVRKVLLSLNGAIHPIIDDQRTSIDRSHTTVVCYDVVQCGVLVPGLAGALELTGVRDSLPDPLLGFDDLEGKPHRYVPSDVTMQAKIVSVYLLVHNGILGKLTAKLQGYRSRTR
jgi:hypothetical protein